MSRSTAMKDLYLLKPGKLKHSKSASGLRFACFACPCFDKLPAGGCSGFFLRFLGFGTVLAARLTCWGDENKKTFGLSI